MSGVFQNIDPPPPSPPLVRGEDTLAGWRGGGGSIFWKTPDIGLASYSIQYTALYSIICKHFMCQMIFKLCLPCSRFYFTIFSPKMSLCVLYKATLKLYYPGLPCIFHVCI
jgi:hypothetical protein